MLAEKRYHKWNWISQSLTRRQIPSFWSSCNWPLLECPCLSALNIIWLFSGHCFDMFWGILRFGVSGISLILVSLGVASSWFLGVVPLVCELDLYLIVGVHRADVHDTPQRLFGREKMATKLLRLKVKGWYTVFQIYGWGLGGSVSSTSSLKT